MKRLFHGIFLVILILALVGIDQANLFAQKSKDKKSSKSSKEGKKSGSSLDNIVIAKVGNESITYKQLEDAFKKNMNRKNLKLSEVPRDSVNEFLSLYVNYRLKVQDALGRGLDKDSAVVADIKQNRDALAVPYFLEKKLTDPNVERIIKNREREVKLAIIYCSVPAQKPNDTTKAFQRATNVLNAIKKGVDFYTMAKDSSDDETSKELGGVQPFITGGMVFRDLENAAYSTKPGEIFPTVIRNPYGYFIVKILENIPRVKVHASHILLAGGDADSVMAHRRADSVLKLINSGAPFNVLAQQNSDDKGSGAKGGDLGGYYTRSLGFENASQKLVPEFEDAMFSLKDGQISGAVKSSYGYHIIRRDTSKSYTRDEELETVKKIYKKQYYEKEKEDLVENLKLNYGWQWNTAVRAELMSNLDSSKTTLDTVWSKKISTELRTKTLYFMPEVSAYAKQGKKTVAPQMLPSEAALSASEKFTVGAFVDSLTKRSDMRATSLGNEGIRRAIGKLVDGKVLAKATKNLETDYPDFAILMKEFRDGILIFKVEEQEVWSKLKFDSARARVFFDSTKSRYRTETKYDLTEIFVTQDSTAQKLYAQAQKGGKFEDIAAQNTERKGFREKKGKWGAVSVKESKLAGRVADNKARAGDILMPMPFEKGFSIVKVNDVLDPRQKTFEEAIPDFAAQFQDLVQKDLSKQWIENLKSKYHVEIQTATINTLWTK